MNLKLLSMLILNFNLALSSIYSIKNDGISKLFIVNLNSGYAISIEPNKIGEIDATLKGLKKIFINETLNFYEEEQPNSENYKLKYQLRSNKLSLKLTELSYFQIKHLAYQPRPNQEFVITPF